MFYFLLDKNRCSLYNVSRTKIPTEVTAMTAMGYVIVIVGALSASVNLMHLIDRLERRPQRRRTAA